MSRASATRAPTSSSTSSTPAGTASSRSRRWRSASPSSRYLDPEAVERSAAGFGIRLPIVPATKETLAEALAPAGRESRAAPRDRRRQPPLRRAGARHRPRSPTACSTIYACASRLCASPRETRSASCSHTAIYGSAGSSPAILAVVLLPLYTHYLAAERLRAGRDRHRGDRGALDRAADGDLERLLPLLLRHEGPRHRLLVVRTSFWFTMGMATIGLVLGLVFATSGRPLRSASATTRRSSAPAQSACGRRRTTSR